MTIMIMVVMMLIGMLLVGVAMFLQKKNPKKFGDIIVAVDAVGALLLLLGAVGTMCTI